MPSRFQQGENTASFGRSPCRSRGSTGSDPADRLGHQPALMPALRVVTGGSEIADLRLPLRPKNGHRSTDPARLKCATNGRRRLTSRAAVCFGCRARDSFNNNRGGQARSIPRRVSASPNMLRMSPLLGCKTCWPPTANTSVNPPTGNRLDLRRTALIGCGGLPPHTLNRITDLSIISPRHH